MKSHDFFFIRLAKIMANQDREDELVKASIVVTAAEGSQVETLGSYSNFSNLDLNKFESNENLPCFFQYNPPAMKLVEALAIDDVASPT